MSTLEEKLAELSASEMLPLHMPGHKRQPFPYPAATAGTDKSTAAAADEDTAAAVDKATAAAVDKATAAAADKASAAAAAEAALSAAMSLDITEIDGFDNLHAPEGIIKEEAALTASLYGARETFFSVNGSTCAMLSAISAAVPTGGRMLIERNAHISVYHAAELRRAEVSYMTSADPLLDLSAYTSDGNWDAVVVTSPTYEGYCRDIKAIADIAHALGAILIVDAAHGAHLGFHPYFPESPTRLGADLVIMSTHKTLPALTQTALLHRCTDRVNGARLQKWLDIYETSSPSYLLLASITHAMHMIRNYGDDLFSYYADNLIRARKRLSSLNNFLLAPADMSSSPGGSAVYDPGKLFLIPRDPTSISPEKLYNLLRDHFYLQPEMKTDRGVLLMTSIADPEETYLQVVTAMEEIDRVYSASNAATLGEIVAPFTDTATTLTGTSILPPSLPPVKMRISDATEERSCRVPLSKAIGKIAADYILIYPPDTPVIVPGEQITDTICSSIRAAQNLGLSVIGCEHDFISIIL